MTEAEFLDTVAEQLGILAAGQTLASEDGALIRRRAVATFARLAREELTTAASTNDIPDAQALALADIVALECAIPFGLSGQLNELAAAARAARDSIRLVVSERPHRETLAVTPWWGPRHGRWSGV